MKLSQLIDGKSALDNLMKQNLPVGIAFELRTFVKKVNPELLSFSELRNEKIKKYGTPTGKFNGPDETYNFTQENAILFNEELKEILESEMDIKVPQIKVSDLIAYSEKTNIPIAISGTDMVLLDWLITE